MSGKADAGSHFLSPSDPQLTSTHWETSTGIVPYPVPEAPEVGADAQNGTGMLVEPFRCELSWGHQSQRTRPLEPRRYHFSTHEPSRYLQPLANM